MKRNILTSLFIGFLFILSIYAEPCSKDHCENGEFVEVKGKCICVCPPGYSGDLCEIPPARDCPAERSGRISWPKTAGGRTVHAECPEGTKGEVSRECDHKGKWGEVQGECEVKRDCPAERSGRISWPKTESGKTARGECPEGYKGNPSRECNKDGSWSQVRDACIPKEQFECPPERSGRVNWPRTGAGETVHVECPEGTKGEVSRECDKKGKWGEVQGECEAKRDCPAERSGRISWPKTESGKTARGECPEGYKGNPSRECNKDGTWSQVRDACIPKEETDCPAERSGRVNWPRTGAGETVHVECPEGTKGEVSRECDKKGKWGPIQGECEVKRDCPAERSGRINWPKTESGKSASAECPKGYKGNPSRECNKDGTWSEVRDACVREEGFCFAEVSHKASWPKTPTGGWAKGVCVGGKVGKPIRQCLDDGSWSDQIYNPCR